MAPPNFGTDTDLLADRLDMLMALFVGSVYFDIPLVLFLLV
jgi:hypothetical protein